MIYNTFSTTYTSSHSRVNMQEEESVQGTQKAKGPNMTIDPDMENSEDGFIRF